MRFSQSTYLLICLFLEMLRSIIRTGSPILAELIHLVNSVIIFLFQMALLRWLTFLFRSLTGTLTVLAFWISFFLLALVFVLQWCSLHWKILIILLSHFHWLSNKLKTGCPVSFHSVLWVREIHYFMLN